MNNFTTNKIININQLISGDQIKLKILTRTKRFLDCNFGKKINFNDLALLQGCSQNQLISMFKSYFGITLNQYLILKRAENV